MAKIEKLTAEQTELLDHTLSKWLSIGRSTQPFNREKASTIITKFYRLIGKEKPMILFFSSPIMCLLAYGVLKKLDVPKKELWGELRSQLWSQLGSQLRSQLWNQLWSQLESQLENQLGSQLESQLRSQLGSQLRSQLWSQLRSQLESQLENQLGSQLESQLRSQLGSQLRSQLGSQLRSQLQNYFGGQHWCAWEVFYLFCNQIGVTYTADELKLLNLWLEQSQELHWWFPYEGLVFASERYTTLNIDDLGRLHSDTTQAVGYSDGWGLWADHGVVLPQWIVEQKRDITTDKINKEKNAEVRRVMVKYYDQIRYQGAYINDLGLKPVQEDRFGTLFQKDFPDGRSLVMVRVTNSTPEPNGESKQYWLKVDARLRPLPEGRRQHPETLKWLETAEEAIRRQREFLAQQQPQELTAHAAVASTFGLRQEQYNPEFES